MARAQSLSTCKPRILTYPTPLHLSWNYDGSSTGQAPGGDSEIYLKPAFMCHDPIRGGDSILVLCEMLTPDMKPIPTSTRSFAKAIFDQGLDVRLAPYIDMCDVLMLSIFTVSMTAPALHDGRARVLASRSLACTANPHSRHAPPLLQEIPWFGIEQEYTLFADGRPLGWPASTARPFQTPTPMSQFGYPGAQGPYYCSVGYDVAFGRDIVEVR